MKQDNFAADSKSFEEVGKLDFGNNSPISGKVYFSKDHDLKKGVIVLEGPNGSISLPLLDSMENDQSIQGRVE